MGLLTTLLLLEACTEKGREIKGAMEKEYGKEKGKDIFFASRNKGTITGVGESLDANSMEAINRFNDKMKMRHCID
jgi:hypothetical protein